MNDETKTKRCPKCDTHKDFLQFYKNRTEISGLCGWCKECMKKLSLERGYGKIRKKYKKKKKDYPVITLSDEWKEIPGFDGTYFVNRHGDVQSLKHGHPRFLKRARIRKGYQIYCLRKPGFKAHTTYVHRIVAEVFIPNPKKLIQVNHKDLDKTNNNATNLEWCSPKENIHHYLKSINKML